MRKGRWYVSGTVTTGIGVIDMQCPNCHRTVMYSYAAFITKASPYRYRCNGCQLRVFNSPQSRREFEALMNIAPNAVALVGEFFRDHPVGWE